MRIIRRDLLKAAAVSLLLISPASAGELLVYSSTDADNLKYYMDEFQKDHPDIKVNVVRESTGTMAAKMMAEKDNPQADVLFEMAATVALNMEEAGIPASDMSASLEDGIARCLRACVETPIEAVFESDDDIAPYEKHILMTMRLRRRRLSNSPASLPLRRPATAPLLLHKQVFNTDDRSASGKQGSNARRELCRPSNCEGKYSG